MWDLPFVHFALIPSSVRKEKQFRLPDDFSLTDEPFRVRFYPRFFEFSHRGRTAVRRSAMFLHDEDEARNVNISALRGRNRRLLAAVSPKTPRDGDPASH